MFVDAEDFLHDQDDWKRSSLGRHRPIRGHLAFLLAVLDGNLDLASFEILLDKLARTVAAGRERLNIGLQRDDQAEDPDDPTKGFFDQDRK